MAKKISKMQQPRATSESIDQLVLDFNTEEGRNARLICTLLCNGQIDKVKQLPKEKIAGAILYYKSINLNKTSELISKYTNIYPAPEKK